MSDPIAQASALIEALEELKHDAVHKGHSPLAVRRIFLAYALHLNLQEGDTSEVVASLTRHLEVIGRRHG